MLVTAGHYVGYTTLSLFPLLFSFPLSPSLSLSDTPLGLACGRNANVQVIMPLLSNGAHIDFRGKEGLTPLHRAALGGNSAAIKVWICPGCLSTSLLTRACIPLLCSITIIDNSLLVNGYCKGKTYLLEI